MGLARILFLSDTHLGFDMPFRPRVERRRRGPDFFANYERALKPAREGRVDCVVHGGDILYRSRVPAELVEMAFRPLKQIADQGVPVYVVPGNHERSSVPCGLLAEHPRIFVFDRPRTYTLSLPGIRLALAGFPFVREQIRTRFPDLVGATGWESAPADGRILCLHQAIEGATVGPVGYVFRSGGDVVRASDIPTGFTTVLAGHVHRVQVLTRDLRGRLLPTPVFYAGSIERTSFAERNERKGYLILEIENRERRSVLRRWVFSELPTRPMVQVDLPEDSRTGSDLRRALARTLDRLPADAVVRIRTGSDMREETVRSLAPPTMNLSVRPAGQQGFAARGLRRTEPS